MENTGKGKDRPRFAPRRDVPIPGDAAPAPCAGDEDSGADAASNTLRDIPRRRLRKRCKMGEVLLEAGVLDQETLDIALRLGKEKKIKLGQVVIEMGLADELLVTKTLAYQLNIPCVDPSKLTIGPDILAHVPRALAYKHRAIPLKKSGNKLIVAMEDPTDYNAEDDLRFAAGLDIQPVIASRQNIFVALEAYYPPEEEKIFLPETPVPSGDLVLMEEAEGEQENNTRELLLSSQRSPIVHLSNSILREAVRRKASDIHIDPHQDKVLVRYRVDGVLAEHARLDKGLLLPLVSRLKVLSGMDISIRRRPQDGRIRIRLEKTCFDLRVSTLPASHGEKVVVRILGQDKGSLCLEDMGFSPGSYRHMDEALGKTSGIILVTGPTGSGKSTTLYACLNRLKTPEVNIVTVEDPVEYEMEGINQIQINTKAGLNFAACLRSILRQDPNIIMIGEIRDSETASIAVQASLTGHLVLSTLHTNDAPATVGRLLDLRVEPFLLASSLEAVVAQRLVRRICPHCARPEKVPRELMSRFPVDPGSCSGALFATGAGCERCHHTGYSGRIGIFETLRLTPAMREAVSGSPSITRLRAFAEREGYRPMALDGLDKARAGLTSISEVFRVAVMENQESSNGNSPAPCSDSEAQAFFPSPSGRNDFEDDGGLRVLIANMEEKQSLLEARLAARDRELAFLGERIRKLERALRAPCGGKSSGEC